MDHMDREGLARLGVAVIKRAVRDTTCLTLRAPDRDEARVFLDGGPMLGFWAEVAGISMDRVQQICRRSTMTDARSPR